MIELVPLYSENDEKRQQVEATIHCLFSLFSVLIDCGLSIIVITANKSFVVISAITIILFYLKAVLYQPVTCFLSGKDHAILS
jgi:hypothetical protein